MVALVQRNLERRMRRIELPRGVASWNPTRTPDRQPAVPAMNPTVYVPTRRGEVVTYRDVVARRV